jgi:hypothetical protein
MEFFNIWDLERINIKLNPQFFKNINQEILFKYKTKRNAYNNIFYDKEIPQTTFRNLLKESNMKKFFVPLEIFIRICEKLNIPKEVLQENIISYKTSNGINYIEKPILPIKITPVFHMLFAHHIGDGTVINPKKGRLPYFGYRQFDKFYRINYIRKIESVFGKINFKEEYFEKSTRPYCPSAISTTFFKYYGLNVNGFLSKTARIPNKIYFNGKDHLLAILLAFIIDEGHIDSTLIVIGLKNKSLVLDLKKICDSLEYRSKITYRDGDYEDYGYLYILREGMKNLYKDYLLLNVKYPVVDMGWKGVMIENSLKIYSRDIKRVKGNKEIILKILKNEQLSVNQLAIRLNMTRQGIRFHIHNLIKDKKIKVLDKNNPNWIYGV